MDIAYTTIIPNLPLIIGGGMVLERIATDPGARLDREIAGLNANLN